MASLVKSVLEWDRQMRRWLICTFLALLDAKNIENLDDRRGRIFSSFGVFPFNHIPLGVIFPVPVHIKDSRAA